MQPLPRPIKSEMELFAEGCDSEAFLATLIKRLGFFGF